MLHDHLAPGPYDGDVTVFVPAGALLPLRLRAHLLGGQGAGSVSAAVGHMAGIQAQAAPPARLAIRARTSGITAAEADRACGTGRDVTRTWAMRGTLHAVATAGRELGRAGSRGGRHRAVPRH